jgi:hypothetical protein
MDVDPGSRRLSLLRRPEEDDILVPRHGQELSGSGAVTVRPRTLCSCQAAAPTSNADSDGAKTAAALPTLSLEDAINEPKLHSAAVADDQGRVCEGGSGRPCARGVQAPLFAVLARERARLSRAKNDVAAGL